MTISEIGCGSAIIVVGLIFDAFGVVLTLISLAGVTSEEIETRAQRSSASYYGSNSALRDRLLVQLFRERRLVRWGLGLLIVGFILQGVGTLISAGVKIG